MKTSQKGIDLIKRFEGLRLDAYKDPVGVVTIGYGHTKGVKMGDKITSQEAENLLKEDLVRFEKNVFSYDSLYHWNQNEFDALVSFAFNIGNINQLTNNGKRTKEQISWKITSYNRAGGKVLSGLTKRRNAELELFKTPISSQKDTLTSSTNPYKEPVRVLKFGSRGEGVKWLQFQLNMFGYDLKVDGLFGSNTDKAILSFQQKHNLASDKIVGKKTREVLKGV